MSALPPKADIERHDWHVRFVPLEDICSAANLHSIRSPRRRAAAGGTARRRRAPSLQTFASRIRNKINDRFAKVAKTPNKPKGEKAPVKQVPSRVDGEKNAEAYVPVPQPP